MTSTDSTLLGFTENAARMVLSDYSIGNYYALFIMIIAAISLALIITSVTEKLLYQSLVVMSLKMMKKII